MARTYNVIDSDGHVLEPRNFWQEYIDPRYRDRAPALIVDSDGKDRFQVEGKLLGPPAGLGLIGAIGVREKVNGEWRHAPKVAIDLEYTQGRKGGFDPHARMQDMDLDGIDAAFLYPSLGPVCRGDPGPGVGRSRQPGLQPLAGRLLPAVPGPAVRGGHAAHAVD